MFLRDREPLLFPRNFCWEEEALLGGSIKSRGTYGNVWTADLCGLTEIESQEGFIYHYVKSRENLDRLQTGVCLLDAKTLHSGVFLSLKIAAFHLLETPWNSEALMISWHAVQNWPAPSQQSRTCDFCSLTAKFWPVSVELFVPLSCKSLLLNSSLFAHQLSPSAGPRAASILSSRSWAHISTSAYCLTPAEKVPYITGKTIRRNMQDVLDQRCITQSSCTACWKYKLQIKYECCYCCS